MVQMVAIDCLLFARTTWVWCPFLALPLIHSGRIFSFKKILKFTHILFEGRSTRICMTSIFFGPLYRLFALCQDNIGVEKVITPLLHFSHFHQSIVGELFNSKNYFLTRTPYFEVARLEFA